MINRCRACGERCFKWAEDRVRCWGQVEPIDEIPSGDDLGPYWLHACKGHAPMYEGEPYREQNDD